VRFRWRYQPIQTLASNRSDHPFAYRVCLRAVRWRLEHGQPEIPDRYVQAPSKNTVAIMDEISKSAGSQSFPKWLQRLLGAGVFRHVEMQQST
jgi:hypothetical protein